MATISDKLIQLKNIKKDIKEATNNLGGNVGDDFSTYAEAINRFATYENPNFYDIRTNGGTNYKGLFHYCNTPSLDLSSFNTSNVSNMSYMFSNCSSSIKGIENWDLSNVSDTSYMFEEFTNNSTYLDLSVLDFSNVSNANYMFSNSNTNRLDVRNINLTGTTSYDHLFYKCSGTELDLSNWDVSNVTNLNYVFGFSSYKKIDLTGWNTNKVTNMGNTFYYITPLTTLIIPDWDMTNATSTSNFLGSNSKLKYIDLSRSNDFTINKIASFLPTYTATTFGEMLVPADTSQDAIDAFTAKYWKPIGPKLDLISTELAFELDEVLPGKTTKVWTGNSDPWYGDDRLETIEFISSDESVATIDGRVITSTGVEGTVEISARNKETQAILGTATLTISETDSKPNLIKFRTTGSESSSSTLLVINGSNIKASQCTKDAAGIYSYDPGTQITSIMFYYNATSYINEIVKFNFNAANITDAKEMFRRYQGTTLDLSDWDTSHVYDMRSMFDNCSYLVEIKGEIDFSNATSVAHMFTSCSNLEILYLKNIFKNCNMTNNNNWSIDLGKTKVKNECLIYIINELPDLYNDKGLTSTYEITFTLPPTNTLTEEQVQVAIDKGWTVANITYEVNE